MFWLLLVVVIVAALYVFRVPLLAKMTGQRQARVRRALERRKRH
jgi:F0F1-type ATP synthase membrane subunit b/b'